MTTPPPDCRDAEKKRLLAQLLATRISDRIVDVSCAINATFFSTAQEKTNGVAPDIGCIFLTSAAAARRGNLTEKFIFNDNQKIMKHRPSEEVQTDGEKNRWIRGVLTLSSTIPLPPESTFMNHLANGRTLQFGNNKLSLPLMIRVVGVSLPLFVPRAAKAVRASETKMKMITTTARTIETAAPEKRWRMVLESEYRFLQSFELCLMWLLRSRCRERIEKVFTPQRHREHHTSDAKAMGTLFFSEEPAILSVPVYYFPVHMEDNATSRIADVVGASSEFIDIIVDRNMSVVKETTHLLQDLIKLSGVVVVQSAAGGDSKSQQSLDNLLLSLHSCVVSLLERTTEHCPSLVKNHKEASSIQLSLFDKNNNDTHNEFDVARKESVVDDSEVVKLFSSPIPLVLSAFVADDENKNESYCHSRVNDLLSSLRRDENVKEHDGEYCNKALYSLPGVLVHCVKGVSRSPSIIMAYYLHKCCQVFYTLSRVPRVKIVENESLLYGEEQEECMEERYVFSFRRLLQCLQEVRPVVNPQVCFLVELRSMWLRLSKNISEKEGVEEALS